MQVRAKLVCGVSAGVLLAGLGSVAQAADQAAASVDSTQLEELVVTAQRRAETSQTVPISITVLSGEALRGRVRTSGEITQMVPNIQLGAPIGLLIFFTALRPLRNVSFCTNGYARCAFDDLCRLAKTISAKCSEQKNE